MDGIYCEALVVLITLTVFSCLADGQPCPFHPGCTCESKNGSDITCSSLGSNIPAFVTSAYFFKRLTIYGGNQIVIVNESAFKNIHVSELIITQTAIPSFRCNDFTGLENSLTTLRIIRGTLIDVPACTISGLTNLHLLSLQNNKIRTIQKNDFASLTLLQTLDLSYNNIQIIETGAFSGLSYLQTLYLHYNNIIEVAVALFQPLTSLKTLFIYNNRMSAIPIGLFDYSKRLEYLHLGSNILNEIPQGIFEENWNLLRLVLSDNNIVTFPEKVLSTQINLLHFYVEKNQLSYLPSSLFRNTPKLKRIYCSKNRLQKFQWDILYGLDNFRQLFLANSVKNGSVVISPRFKDYWPNLDTINLHNSKVTAILPDSINNLPYLVTVDLSNNEIDTIPEKIFENCLRLRYVRLQNNLIASIHPSVIDNFGPSLQVLDLLNNPLSCSTIMTLSRKLPMLTGLKQVRIPTVDSCPCFPYLPNGTKYTCDNDTTIVIQGFRSSTDGTETVLHWSTKGQGDIRGFRLVYRDLVISNKITERLLPPDVRSVVLSDILPDHNYNVCISLQKENVILEKLLCTMAKGRESSQTIWQNETIYIAMGSALGGFVLIVVVLNFIIWKLKCSKTSHVKRHGKDESTCNTDVVYSTVDDPGTSNTVYLP